MKSILLLGASGAFVARSQSGQILTIFIQAFVPEPRAEQRDHGRTDRKRGSSSTAVDG